MLLCCLERGGFAKAVNEQCFMLKFLLVCGMVAGLLFVPNYYLRYFVEASAYASLLFVVYQSIALVDFGYMWNEAWVRRHEEGRNFYGVMLVLASLVMLAAVSLTLASNFRDFWRPGCSYNKLSLIANVAVIVLLLALVLLKYNQSSSVLTALFIALLVTYEHGLALSSFWVEDCNPYADASTRHTFLKSATMHIFVNLLRGILAVVVVSIGHSSSENFVKAGLHYRQQSVMDDARSLSVSNNQDADDENIKSFLQKEFRPSFVKYRSNYFVLFHAVMMAFAIYLVMIFFDWRRVNIDLDNWTDLVSANPSGFAIKTFNSLLLIVLYIWTLLAPAVFPDRDFE